MELLIFFFVINIVGYAFWRIQMELSGFDIKHNTLINLLITILFFFPLQFGGYLDIQE